MTLKQRRRHRLIDRGDRPVAVGHSDGPTGPTGSTGSTGPTVRVQPVGGRCWVVAGSLPGRCPGRCRVAGSSIAAEGLATRSRSP